MLPLRHLGGEIVSLILLLRVYGGGAISSETVQIISQQNKWMGVLGENQFK